MSGRHAGNYPTRLTRGGFLQTAATLQCPQVKWMDGRVDDPNAGWKGKGLWATVSTRAPFHMEGGKGTTSKVVKFQLRPDPLAR